MAICGSFIMPNLSIPLSLKTPTSIHVGKKQFLVRCSKNSSDEEDRTIIMKDNDRWKIDYSERKPATPLLDTINYPLHTKNLSIHDLEQLAAELRADIIHSVSDTGGHLSSSLGVVELAVSLHHVFNTPNDKIIWDVGHQAYPHKILTGRRHRMHTLRKTSGLAGFPKRDESAHDAFGAGHSSTSISAGLGMAVARDLLGKSNSVISVIGDGGMTAGQAFEAMNNAGVLKTNLIIILNDNKQVSLPTATLDGPASPVGALSGALNKIKTSRKFRKLRKAAKYITKQIGGQTHEVAAKVDEYARGMVNANESTFFEELGLYYIGPLDGHNVEDLVEVLEKVKAEQIPGPVMIHVVTEKGKGYPPAEAAPDKMHGVVKFNPRTGKQMKPKSSTLSYTQYFAESLIKEAKQDNKIVAVHAAMGGGTGLNYFQKKWPKRCFDDQVIHDVDLQKLPVRFAIDRAGMVGADGPTHCGAFDITYMACLPNMVVMAPSDEAELMHMVATAVAIDDRPSCFRFPRGNGVGADLPPDNKGTPLEIGKGRILIGGTIVALLGYGSMVQQCLQAAELLKSHGVFVTVADARFCKPLDTDLIKQLVKEHEILITVEEGSIGGFGSHVSHYLTLAGLLDGPLKWRAMMLPDR
ncbi:hypothetical protein K1719_003726 [Acacia pycnantha]|nr:hypothetical protein K1719_003726 [Acacia pycnantha]